MQAQGNEPADVRAQATAPRFGASRGTQPLHVTQPAPAFRRPRRETQVFGPLELERVQR